MRPIRTEGGEMSNWQLDGVTTEDKLHIMVRTADFQ